MTPTPTPPPTLTPEEAAHAALSQLLPWYDDPPYPLAVLPILEVWLKDAEGPSRRYSPPARVSHCSESRINRSRIWAHA